MQEKLQSFADGKYDLERRDIENIYLEQQGDVAEQLDNLNITHRIASTGEFISGREQPIDV
jgi:amphiphysin